MAVNINKGKVGPNALSGNDGESGLILHGVSVAGNIELGEVKTLFSLNDATDLGLDAAYDSTNNVRVYRHIKEFYRILTKLNVQGMPLHIMLVDNSVTGGNLDVTLADIFEDTASTYAKKMLINADGEIKLLAAAINPGAGYVPVILDNMDAEVRNAIPKAQLFADWAWDTNKPVHVFLEGREFTGTAAAALDLKDNGVDGENVSLTILQDYLYADGLDAVGQKYADVGTLLGVAAAIAVNENVGELESLDIQDIARAVFLNPGISSHQSLKEVIQDAATFDTKGYIMGVSYDDYPGIYFNDQHCCVAQKIDDEGRENINTIALSRTTAKLRRGLRKRYLPKIKSTHRVDATTGKLPPGKIQYFQGIGNAVFNQMDAAGEISGGRTIVDPNSDLQTAPRALNVDYELVPTVSIGVIRGSLNVKTSLS